MSFLTLFFFLMSEDFICIETKSHLKIKFNPLLPTRILMGKATLLAIMHHLEQVALSAALATITFCRGLPSAMSAAG